LCYFLKEFSPANKRHFSRRAFGLSAYALSRWQESRGEKISLQSDLTFSLYNTMISDLLEMDVTQPVSIFEYAFPDPGI
jgi:hypothetical protein